MRAAGRLSAKLSAARGSGRPVDMEEEFRLLTLQVIGEAVLSLPPEDCDRVRSRAYPAWAQHDRIADPRSPGHLSVHSITRPYPPGDKLKSILQKGL